MLRKQRMIMVGVVAIAAWVATGFAQTPDDVAKIKDALPKSATAKPSKPRKLLVFSLATGYQHDSILHGAKAFQLMGEATGAYEATLSQDLAVFDPANLAQFDAILMNNTSGELFTTPSVQQSLVDFVRTGKGLVGIHGAATGTYSWPAYGDMLGGVYDGAPWSGSSQVRVKVEDANHPVAKAFAGAPIDLTEEIYQFKDPFSRHKVRVLTSLDTQNLDVKRAGVKRADRDFPISWVKPYGKGRVFYCSLGHNQQVFQDPRVLQHYLDGIQFALGDLRATAQPVAAIALEKQNLAFDAAEASLRTYDYGTTESASGIFDSLTRATKDAAAARNAFVARLVSVATDPAYSVAARELTLRHIPYSAKENDVKGLFPLLTDSNAKIAEMTRYALGPIAGESVSKAFREAADSSTSDTQKAGLIRVLGTRRDKNAVAGIAKHADNSSSELSSAAIDALGKIGTPQSAQALQKIFAAADGEAKAKVGDALVDCAGVLAAQGDRGGALRIYESLLQEKGSHGFRLAAFTGFAGLSRNPSDLALETLLGKDSQLRSAAGTMLTAAKDNALNRKLAAAIKGQTQDNQIALLNIARAREAREAMEPARELLAAAQTTETKAAAISALGVIGDESVLIDLLKIAADKDDELAEQARTSINQLRRPGIDEYLISLIDPRKKGETEGVIAQAIQAVGSRELTAAVPALLENARVREENNLKAESYDALARLVTAADAPTLLEMNYQVTSEKVRSKADRALLAAISKMEPPTSQSAFLVDAIEPAPSVEARASILKLLGKLGGKNSYKALKKFLKSQDEQLKDAAIRALADFPGAEPINDLIKIARDNSATEVHRILSLRGAARMLSLNLKRQQKETLKLASTVLRLATTDEDKKIVIGNLGDVKQPGIIELVEPMLGTEALALETSATILKLAPHVWMYSPKQTSKTLTAIMSAGLSDAQKQDIGKITEQMDKLTSAVTGWQVAGPYSDPAVQDLTKLLTTKFEPETSGPEAIKWKAAGVGSDSANLEIVDLDKALGNTRNSVAYLRSFLIADVETTASLRVGSDDGILVWVNGKEVLSAPGPRSYTKAQDVVAVPLSEGRNEILAKVTQGEGPWRASVIVESPDGGRLEGVTVKAFPGEKE